MLIFLNAYRLNQVKMGTRYLYSVKLDITPTVRAHDAHLQYFFPIHFYSQKTVFKITLQYGLLFLYITLLFSCCQQQTLLFHRKTSIRTAARMFCHPVKSTCKWIRKPRKKHLNIHFPFPAHGILTFQNSSWRFSDSNRHISNNGTVVFSPHKALNEDQLDSSLKDLQSIRMT